MKKVVLLNTAIVTTTGTFKVEEISLEDARKIVNGADEFTSAIGHQSTADVLTTLLETTVEMNRMTFTQEDELALIFKLKSRAPEGVILSKEEIEKIGYSFMTMEKLS